MPGLSITFDIVTGKFSVNAWILASDLIGFGLKLAPICARAFRGKRRIRVGLTVLFVSMAYLTFY